VQGVSPSGILTDPRGLSHQSAKIKETCVVCHSALCDPNFYVLLSRIDDDRAAEVRAAGCSCGGVLHSARYPRKPRAGPLEYRQLDHRRLSFCCNRCRQRHTPRSVRYLGRRVYLGAGGPACFSLAVCPVGQATACAMRDALRPALNPRSLARLVEFRLPDHTLLAGNTR